MLMCDESEDRDEVTMQEMSEEYNRELNLASRIVEDTGISLFLTGKAGTGKTTFLRWLRKHSSKSMIVLAPTGVAAINAHGMTIHSFFQLPLAPYQPGTGFVGQESHRYNFPKIKKRIIRSIDLIVIDEISMVRPDILDAIDEILRRLRASSEPFGGVQLLLIGDLRQLAPVVKESDAKFLSQYYKSPYFFESQALKSLGFLTIELQRIYRQNNAAFVKLLNSVRDGSADNNVLAKLNSRYVSVPENSEWNRAIRLVSHNAMADSINKEHLEALRG